MTDTGLLMNEKSSIANSEHSTQLGSELGRASIPAVNQYLQLAYRQNIATSEVLQELGIEPQTLLDNNQHISGVQFQQLIKHLVKVSEDQLFGLHTAQFVQPASYSILGFISMNCSTLGEAITKIQPFEKLVGDMGTTAISQQENSIVISWLCNFPDPIVKRHMVDNCLASWLTFARYLTNQNSKPTKVLLTRPQPEKQYQEEYIALFDCPVLFNQATDSLFFSPQLLELPLHQGNQQLLASLESQAKAQLSNLSIDTSIVSQTQKLIKDNLQTGHFHQKDIAELLGISGKTLQRRLKAESTHFQRLLNQVRLQQAFQLLEQHQLKLTEISQQLGFSEPRSFYRYFSRLTQYTPGEYRRKILSEK